MVSGKKMQTILTELKKHQCLSSVITGGELAKKCDMSSGQEVRDIINTLRRLGNPICATSKGYYYSDSRSAIEAEIKSLQGRAQDMIEAAEGLKRCLVTCKDELYDCCDETYTSFVDRMEKYAD